MKIYLARHGQTDWNNEKRFQGHRDIPMNETGIRQMEELARRIREKGITFTGIISSPLKRARKSAEIIAEKTGYRGAIVIDEDLIERDCGLLEGTVWKEGLDPDDPAYGLESIPDLMTRAERALGKYDFSDDEKILIVSHGAILSAVRTVLSDGRIEYFDRSVPVIQGNVLCCEKEDGKESVFHQLF
ncbi:MAG: histidine phosphatase family protein [Clostridia bacterium]|nr:histidine phosphatase family protein [Clostridia bacterium]